MRNIWAIKAQREQIGFIVNKTLLHMIMIILGDLLLTLEAARYMATDPTNWIAYRCVTENGEFTSCT